jgi:hypothetical protein
MNVFIIIGVLWLLFVISMVIFSARGDWPKDVDPWENPDDITDL